ncbi:MAG: glycosyltransferase [bacterium]|nr:glycosyltransferase [bacterium]MCY3632632.1 glycosyltransferase [bacterium]
MSDYIIQHQIPIVLNYHNITPASFFSSWQPDVAAHLRLGYQQLSELTPLTLRAITDSHFNARELTELGIEDVAVSPVLWTLDDSLLDEVPREAEQSAIAEDGGTILFVGRIAPNKCHHDLIMAFGVLSRTRPKSRLVLIGDPSSDHYSNSLKYLARRLGVYDRVFFAGKVSTQDLLRCYQMADVFVSASEHEGFGVPIVEAMASGLPVIAYNAAAVAETVDGVGIVLDDKRPVTLAQAIDRVLRDDRIRQDLCARGKEAAKRYDISVTGRQMWDALRDLLDASPSEVR